MLELSALRAAAAFVTARLRAAVGDERGVTDTVIMIAVLAVLALAVGAIITTKVISKANSIATN